MVPGAQTQAIFFAPPDSSMRQLPNTETTPPTGSKVGGMRGNGRARGWGVVTGEKGWMEGESGCARLML